MAFTILPDKDPDSVEPYFIVWCSADGTNDGSANDTGELQGATISTSTWTVETGLTEDSSNTSSVTIQGITYAINTAAAITLSGGTADTEYTLTNRITTSDGRTLDKSVIICCFEQ